MVNITTPVLELEHMVADLLQSHLLRILQKLNLRGMVVANLPATLRTLEHTMLITMFGMVPLHLLLLQDQVAVAIGDCNL